MRVDSITLGSFGIGWAGSHYIPSESLYYRLPCCKINIFSYIQGALGASKVTEVFVNE